MIEDPRLTALEATPIAFIRLTVPREDMPKVFGPAVGELISAADRLVNGPVFAHHLSMDSKTFDFELGVPVSAPVAPSGRVEAGERPTTGVAQTIYHGPYDGLPAAWEEFHAWVKQSGRRWASDIWECYLVHPDSEPDPAKWETQLNRPILD
ncbi:MAG TPA: GyrI-like domain-containing protein [Gammaproteobacteria bacterium]|nr:GyrI-like domain-containing protein [Gammaproteobacteria bacterium]